MSNCVKWRPVYDQVHNTNTLVPLAYYYIAFQLKIHCGVVGDVTPHVLSRESTPVLVLSAVMFLRYVESNCPICRSRVIA